MVDVRPFFGIRYSTASVGTDLSAVTCPPYDVISPAERVGLLQRERRNIVRLELPQAAEPGGSPYVTAAGQYREWLADGTLVAEGAPAIYAYLQEFGLDGRTHSRRGIIAALRLDPSDSGLARPHERTLPGPKQDRLELMRACWANFSPIWCLYQEATPATERLWRQLEGREPDAHAVDADGVRHLLWVVTAPRACAQVHAAFAAASAYIADGHHRYETARHFQHEAAAAGTLVADSATNFAMTYLVDSSDPGLVVFSTHRLLDLRGGGRAFDAATFRHALGRWFDLADGPDDPAGLLRAVEGAGDRPAFGIWAPGAGLRSVATLRGDGLVPEELSEGHSAPWRRLDLAALHTLFIDRLWPEKAAGLAEAGMLRYTRSLAEVEATVRGGRAQLAVLVRPTRVEQVIAVADAGDLMPEKSTYFYPKPLTGLVMARLDGLVPAVEEPASSEGNAQMSANESS